MFMSRSLWLGMLRLDAPIDEPCIDWHRHEQAQVRTDDEQKMCSVSRGHVQMQFTTCS